MCVCVCVCGGGGGEGEGEGIIVLWHANVSSTTAHVVDLKGGDVITIERFGACEGLLEDGP